MTPLRLILSVIAAATSASPLHAQVMPERMDMRGTLGPYRVGATMWIKNGKTFVTGHYFYVTRLTDIPLTSLTQNAPTLDLAEPGNGAFHLHFTGNGSNKGAPFNFDNSVALDGTWTQGARTLPVHLGFESATPAGPEDRRYADVTSETDKAFEIRVQRFTSAVLSGDRRLVATNISFPLEINGKQKLRVPNQAALIAHWEQIFTASFVVQLQQAVPHDMFVRNGMAMLGNGLVWFDAKGATSINLP